MTNFNQLDLNASYTYADYLTWKFEERVELIKGRIWKMSPAPARVHQKISGNIFYLFKHFLKGNNCGCEVYDAPFDVRLSRKNKKNEEITTVVQPDICVICDLSKLDDKGCVGVPDLVIEILSPGNSRKEMREKFALYQEAGVPEYWMVSTTNSYVLVYVLDDNGLYRGLAPFIDEDQVPVRALPGFEVDLKEVIEGI